MDSSIRFTRTAEAAQRDRVSKWDVIEAVALDAVDNDLPITGAESIVEAKKAFAEAGDEHTDSTVKGLCVVAKFDFDSTPVQRKTWRRYGWSCVSVVADAGWSPEAAYELLDGERKTWREIQAAVGSRPSARPEKNLDDQWADWAARMNKVLMDGNRLDGKTEEADIVLGSHAATAREIYHRLVERQLNAEIRQLFDSEQVD